MSLDAFRMGSNGAVPALANFRPELFTELIAAITEGDDERAEALQLQITETRKATRGDGIATLKRNVAAMLRTQGVAYSDNGVRAPLR